jgi:N-acetylglucosamine-6-phosphate deacetylase
VNDLLIRADAVVLPHTVAVGAGVLVSNGRIVAVGENARAAAGTPERKLAGTLLPGLVDLQVNGMGGARCESAAPAELDRVAEAVLRGGACAFLPTLITAPFEQMLARTQALAEWILGYSGRGAAPLGVHLEGPFLEASGAHDAAWFVDPTPERVDALLAAARGTLRLVTLAPGRAGSVEAVRRLRAAGVRVSIGHAEGDERFAACVDAGASLVTHLFNAMGPLHHRRPGIAGRALDEPRVRAMLIADGAHVDPVMLRNAFRCLGVERTLLVTDAVAAAGMPDGRYELSGIGVTSQGGVVRDAAGRLAGSALTMAQAAARFARDVPGVGPWTLARVAATNAARALGAERDWGTIEPGRLARFTLLSASGELSAL